MARGCFYCGSAVEPDQERVVGVKVVAHRSCVRAKLVERFGEDWESRITDQNPASLRGERAVRRRKAGADA